MTGLNQRMPGSCPAHSPSASTQSLLSQSVGELLPPGTAHDPGQKGRCVRAQLSCPWGGEQWQMWNLVLSTALRAPRPAGTTLTQRTCLVVKPVWAPLPFLSPTRNHLSNKLLVLESLSRSLLRENPNQDNIYITWNRCSVSKW